LQGFFLCRDHYFCVGAKLARELRGTVNQAHNAEAFAGKPRSNGGCVQFCIRSPRDDSAALPVDRLAAYSP
jgi:hypothetical protein